MCVRCAQRAMGVCIPRVRCVFCVRAEEGVCDVCAMCACGVPCDFTCEHVARAKSVYFGVCAGRAAYDV